MRLIQSLGSILSCMNCTNEWYQNHKCKIPKPENGRKFNFRTNNTLFAIAWFRIFLSPFALPYLFRSLSLPVVIQNPCTELNSLGAHWMRYIHNVTYVIGRSNSIYSAVISHFLLCILYSLWVFSFATLYSFSFSFIIGVDFKLNNATSGTRQIDVQIRVIYSKFSTFSRTKREFRQMINLLSAPKFYQRTKCDFP